MRLNSADFHPTRTCPSRNFCSANQLLTQHFAATRAATVPPSYRNLGSLRTTNDLIRGLKPLPYADRILE